MPAGHKPGQIQSGAKLLEKGEYSKMKTGKLSIERSRTFTLENEDIYPEMVCENDNGKYTYSECAASKALLLVFPTK